MSKKQDKNDNRIVILDKVNELLGTDDSTLINGLMTIIKNGNNDSAGEIENLKSVTRTAWTKTGRRESTAEHSWRLSMLLMVLEEDFKDIDINKAIKMSLVHDLGELYDGDISATLQHDNDNKSEMEERAMNRMLKVLPESISKQIYDLWAEYNKCATKEAKLVKAMDKLETIVQHNQGTNPKDFDYEFNLTYGKKYFEDDDTLKYMRNIIDEDTKNKIKSAY